MKRSRTGKPVCSSRCNRLATHEGSLYRSHGRLAVLVYCEKHIAHVADAQPLGYYSTHFPFIDELCLPVSLHQLALINGPGAPKISLTAIICLLLHKGWTQSDVREWFVQIAGSEEYYNANGRLSLRIRDLSALPVLCDNSPRIIVKKAPHTANM